MNCKAIKTSAIFEGSGGRKDEKGGRGGEFVQAIYGYRHITRRSAGGGGGGGGGKGDSFHLSSRQGWCAQKRRGGGALLCY